MRILKVSKHDNSLQSREVFGETDSNCGLTTASEAINNTGRVDKVQQQIFTQSNFTRLSLIGRQVSVKLTKASWLMNNTAQQIFS